jgi:succinate dehydrogenase/fumarate reductase flavoprotein subunit
MTAEGRLIETDILVIGAGAGGLLAALSAKRHGKSGTRVTLVDAWMAGRTGHSAFSNAWFVLVTPEDNVDEVAAEIVAGNDGIADQLLVREVLENSYARLKDLEGLELKFPQENGAYVRRPTRGLDATRLTYPLGGGLEMCWRLRRGLAAEGVEILDRVFVTALLRGAGGRVIGAACIGSRSGEFLAVKARATIIATNAITFRSGFARDLAGTGTLLAYRAGATLRNAEFSYTRPGTPKFYFEGITHAIQDGARFINERGERFMPLYEPIWGDEADVPRIARAMAIERRKGNAPLYLDMSGVPAEQRESYIRSKVPWMACFYSKLGAEAKTDMFGRTPYYPQNQMTKMAIRTDAACRSDVPGLLAAGLAQAGCANHFAGFHIGMAIGTGWIAGRSAVEDLDALAPPRLSGAEIAAAQRALACDDAAPAESDRILRELQGVMFAYDVSVWKEASRLEAALAKITVLGAECDALKAPHTHELVRLRETEAMLLAAELILRASLFRTESRVSHFREDCDFRDDAAWLCWVDIAAGADGPALSKTRIPTPFYPAVPITDPAPRRAIS